MERGGAAQLREKNAAGRRPDANGDRAVEVYKVRTCPIWGCHHRVFPGGLGAWQQRFARVLIEGGSARVPAGLYSRAGLVCEAVVGRRAGLATLRAVRVRRECPA